MKNYMKDIKQFDYLNTLEELEYIFEGAMIPFVLLGETARRVKEGELLEGIEVLEIGVLKNTMSAYVERTFKDRWGDWKNKVVDVVLSYNGKSIPVSIKFVERNYKFFENLDQKFYFSGNQKIANPFDKYWKIRNLIK